MPIPLMGDLFYYGLDAIPFVKPALPYLPYVAAAGALRYYCSGAKNGNERVLHGKVVIMTGATSGLGLATAYELASRGAQLILLVRSTSDAFLVDTIEDLRERTNNNLIYAEQCDLSSLHSIRLFATKWIDNSPPRRLDMVVCCAGVMAPPFKAREATGDGVEVHWGVNYLGHYHLLTLLSPALKAQPAGRDVRVLMTTCGSYILGDLDINDTQFFQRGYPSSKPWKCYGASKLALMTFCVEFQRRLNSYQRPDKEPNSVFAYTVDPGYFRSPGMRRWLSFGSVWGLLVYVLLWPIWWLVLKSSREGCQSLLTCAMSPECATGEGGKLLKECRTAEFRNSRITDPEFGKALWEHTEKEIEVLEKAAAVERKKKAAAEKKTEENKAPSKPAPSTPAKTTQSSVRPNLGGDTPSQRTRSKTRLAS